MKMTKEDKLDLITSIDRVKESLREFETLADKLPTMNEETLVKALDRMHTLSMEMHLGMTVMYRLRVPFAKLLHEHRTEKGPTKP